jgi:Tfp pilus assembly protein FimT
MPVFGYPSIYMQKELTFLKHAPAAQPNRITLRQGGFSLVELLVVVAVAMIIGGMCAPLLMNTVNQYQLRAASVDLDNLLQQARMRAVRDNKAYAVASNSANTELFFDLNGNGNLDSGEPVVVLPRGASALRGASGGSNPSLSAATLGFTPQSSGVPVMFNARGTPCVQTTVAGQAACTSWGAPIGGSTSPTPVGFIYYVKSVRGSNTVWAAISISPSGRFRVWSYDNHSQTWSK